MTGIDFKFDFLSEQSGYCQYARLFRQWTTGLTERACTTTQHIVIAQAKVMLLDKYYEWRASTPPHGEGHTCLNQVLDEAYGALRTHELMIAPPQLYIPVEARMPEVKPIIIQHESVQATEPVQHSSILGELDRE